MSAANPPGRVGFGVIPELDPDGKGGEVGGDEFVAAIGEAFFDLSVPAQGIGQDVGAGGPVFGGEERAFDHDVARGGADDVENPARADAFVGIDDLVAEGEAMIEFVTGGVKDFRTDEVDGKWGDLGGIHRRGGGAAG